MKRYELYKDGILIVSEERDFTPEELRNNWLLEMQMTDEKMPRATEDLIDAYGTENLNQFTLDAYNLKKSLRSQKP